MLYLVPTPIGNLEDITLRAIRLLKECDLILAEDTRTTGKLLSHFEISTPQAAFHMHNEHKSAEKFVSEMKEGRNMCLVSDAGTPGISDPGYLIVREALKSGVNVECLPGATAFVPALIKSGIPCDRFVFEGFLPHKKGRQTKIKEIAEETRTVVIYESTHRIIKALEQFQEFFEEDRVISVSRELTKKFEETVTGKVAEVLEHFKNNSIKGEFVVVIEGKNS